MSRSPSDKRDVHLWCASLMIAAGTYPGEVCGAKLKRGEGYCRRPAVRTRTRCNLHGGRTPRAAEPASTLSPRQIRNRDTRAARAAARASLAAASANGELHPETMTVFNRNFAFRVSETSRAQFILLLDLRLRGTLPDHVWLSALDALGMGRS